MTASDELTEGLGRSAMLAAIAARAVAGCDAMAVLAAGSGCVEAVFPHSLYLRVGERLLCMGGEDLVRGPLNLCLHALSGRRLAVTTCRQGAPWRYRGGRLCVGSMPVFRLESVAPWTPESLPALKRHCVMRGVDALRRNAARPVLCAHEPGADLRIAASALESGMAALQGWLVAELAGTSTPVELPADVLALLGCGVGLTPSGDDILVGAMVTLAGLGESRVAWKLAAGIQRQMHSRTSRISAAHLDAACRGQAVEPVHAVLRALMTGDSALCARAGERLRGYGQSSGADALAGILLAATVWLRR